MKIISLFLFPSSSCQLSASFGFKDDNQRIKLDNKKEVNSLKNGKSCLKKLKGTSQLISKLPPKKGHLQDDKYTFYKFDTKFINHIPKIDFRSSSE